MAKTTLHCLNVLGYARVSTKGQANDGDSLPVQGQRIRAYCTLHGLPLIDIVEDGGRSGESLRRKGIRLVFERLDAGQASGLVIPDVSRLTRSVRDWSGLVEDRFGTPGGQRLYSVSQQLDLWTPGGRAYGNMLAVFNEYELDNGVVRTGDVMGAKKARGEQLGGLPYGSQLDVDGKTLIANETEQTVIQEILRMRVVEGRTYRGIAGWLNTNSVRTRNGQPWRHSTVAKIVARQIGPTTTQGEQVETMLSGVVTLFDPISSPFQPREVSPLEPDATIVHREDYPDI